VYQTFLFWPDVSTLEEVGMEYDQNSTYLNGFFPGDKLVSINPDRFATLPSCDKAFSWSPWNKMHLE